MEKCFVDRESSLLQEKQNRLDIYNMINDFAKEETGEQRFKESSTNKRKKRLQEIIQQHRSLKDKNNEIMEDFRQIYNPRHFQEYKKRANRRWVGKEGKYLNPKLY